MRRVDSEMGQALIGQLFPGIFQTHWWWDKFSVGVTEEKQKK